MCVLYRGALRLRRPVRPAQSQVRRSAGKRDSVAVFTIGGVALALLTVVLVIAQA